MKTRPARTSGVGRVVGIVMLLSIAVFVVSQRCGQMRRHGDDRLAEGIAILGDALASNSDLGPAERAFIAAARSSLTPGYALFCLSAVDEMRGRWESPEPLPDGWDEAVSSLASGRLEEATHAFQAIEASRLLFRERRRLYLRLVGELPPPRAPAGH